MARMRICTACKLINTARHNDVLTVFGKGGRLYMTGQNIRLAILDNGIHPEACPLAESFMINDNLSATALKTSTVSPLSHGSICARIIQRYTDLENVEVFNIQILEDNSWRGNIQKLLKAFELCISMDIRVVHLSIGTYTFEDFAKLENAVSKLLDSDRFLIASAGNRGTATYPAYLPGVIGVQCHPYLKDDEYAYCHDKLTRIHFQASSKHRLICGGEIMETPMSNSYAAPLITGKLLSYLKTDANLENAAMLRLLAEHAGQYEGLKNSGPCPYPPVEIPVVILNGFSCSRLSCLTRFLLERLYQEGYHARAATDLTDARPWDETALPGSAGLDAFIARMAWYFACDIILLGITPYIPPDTYENVSLWIYGDEGSESLAINAPSNGQVLWAAGMPDSKVYKLMIDMLT